VKDVKQKIPKYLEILSADWAFMWLLFLQPKPHNIMLIL
jgi:hypothetical protein